MPRCRALEDILGFGDDGRAGRLVPTRLRGSLRERCVIGQDQGNADSAGERMAAILGFLRSVITYLRSPGLGAHKDADGDISESRGVGDVGSKRMQTGASRPLRSDLVMAFEILHRTVRQYYYFRCLG